MKIYEIYHFHIELRQTAFLSFFLVQFMTLTSNIHVLPIFESVLKQGMIIYKNKNFM